MNLRVIVLLIILSLTIRGKPIEKSIQAVKASPVMPDKPKKATVKRAKPKKAKLKAADKKAVDFMNSSLGEWIIEYSGSKDIDPFLILAIAERESGLNPNAVGDNGASIGLMQIQPKYHQKRMEELGIVNLYDAQENVILGCAILSDLYDKYGNYEDALSVYNSGNTEDGKAYAERILNK